MKTGQTALPRSIVILGLVSFLMDLSSEMIFAVLPVFILSLGAGPLLFGVMEGVAEAVSLAVKVASGVLSDRSQRRKPWVVSGYLLSALTKPAFALAQSTGAVLGIRFVDRIGKGIRGAPRDALVGDLVPDNQRGSAYGLRQALDTAGAVAGPLLAMLLLATVAAGPRDVFWYASLPAVVCVFLLVAGVREAPRRQSPSRTAWQSPGVEFWRLTRVGVVLALARFSEGFLVLRATELDWPLPAIPLVFVILNLVAAAATYPAGTLSDRFGRRALLLPGIVCLLLADVVLALAPGSAGLVAGIVLWGLHLGLCAGVIPAMIADAAPARIRGSAFGLYNLASGAALLIASVLAGLLWQMTGHTAAFAAGALFASVALLLARGLR